MCIRDRQVLLPVGLAGLVALAQQLLPLAVHPGLDGEEDRLVARIEEVGEAALALEPWDERYLVVRPVGEAVLAVLHLEQRPVAGVHGLARQLDGLGAVRAPG